MTAPKTTTAKTTPAKGRATPSRAAATAAKDPGPKPTYQVVEKTLYAQTSAGELAIPLTSIKTRNMREIMALETDFQQFDYLCESIFPPEVDELPFLEGLPLMTVFFEAFQQFTEASLGESGRSSN